MKNAIYILLFICSGLLAQNQSYYTSETPNVCIFRETFNNEFQVRDNQGTPTAVTFSDGSGSFNGSSSKITYPIQYEIKSIRIRLTSSTTTEDILKLSSTHSISVSSGTISGTGISSPTIYVNGTASSTLTTNESEIIITTATGFTANDIQIGYISTYFDGTIDLVESYNITLTANEVTNLYNNNRFTKPTITPLLEVTAERGVIENLQSGTITNTSTTIARSGSTWVMDYNGSTSILNCDDQGDLTGDVTFSFWAKPRSTGEGGLSRLFNNGGALLGTDNSITCYMYSATPYYIYFRSGESGGYAYAIGFWTYNEWNYVVITRVASTGIVNFYINGQVASVIDNTAGTPVAATQDFTIGNTYNGAASFDGFITDFIIDEGEIWSAAKISQEYTSTKHKYAK